jgi:hypothetical protein
MTNKTSASSNSSASPESGVTDLQWPPLLVALVNFCVEWDRRNRETGRAARAEAQAANDRAAAVQRRVEEEQRRAEEEQRRAEERERAARRARIQNRWIVLQIRHQLAPSEQTRAALTDFASFLQEYGEPS